MSASLRADLLASVVVFLVALPLCMGIAIASGFPPAAGIITGIIGGLIVSPLGGSIFQVTGPAAGLVVIVAELARNQGMERLGLIVMLAGIMQIAGGFAGLALWFRAVPPSVIRGMLSGIGILICASQFHIMVDDTPKSSGLQNIIFIPQAIWKGVTPDSTTSHTEAATIGIITIAVLVLWNRFVAQRIKAAPGALVAIVAATLAAALWHAPVHYVQLPANLSDDLHWLQLPTFSMLLDRNVLLSAAAIAIVASAETLLTASALDALNAGKGTDFGRELRAQGLGNVLCGIAGVLPLTGVMVRSGVNLNAGAKSRLSATMHALWLLVPVAFFPEIVSLIPTSSLAALLVYAGFELADLRATRDLARYGRGEVLIYWVTALSIVCIDLLSGVTIGVA
ncbi:MAG: SulP family inorganic anion transporter, partial [Terriglobales bacterium]